MIKQFRVLRVGRGGSAGKVEVGDAVYEQSGYDYGLSRDDSRATGVSHITVTKNSDGDYPGFTIPLVDLLPDGAELNPLATDQDPNHPKKYMGVIREWGRIHIVDKAYFIVGQYCGFGTEPLDDIRTSFVVSYDEKTGQIETRNSRYTLEGPEKK
jgi:hypothetical protein